MSLAERLRIKAVVGVFRFVQCECGEEAWHWVPCDDVPRIVPCVNCKRTAVLRSPVPRCLQS